MDGPVVVMGSGIVGTSTAWKLQTGGAQTILIGEPDRGVSYASFASLSAFDEPLTEVYTLKSLGISHWRRWNREFGGDLGLTWDGEIRWAETQESARALSQKIARASRRGYSVESISPEELMEKLPSSRPAQILEASYAPEDGQAEPPKAIARLREAFQEAGGRVIPGLARLRIWAETVLVRVEDAQIEARTVIVASGTETANLLEKLGSELPMEPSPGLLVLTEPTEPVVKGTVYVSPITWPSVHLRQLSDGRVMIGERSQEYAATKLTMKHARELLRQAQRSFPVLNRTPVENYTVQWRPMPRDRMPIIGPLPGIPSVYVATGHAGVTTAPAIASLLTQEIVEGHHSLQLEPFGPARFADQRTYLAREVEAAFNPGV